MHSMILNHFTLPLCLFLIACVFSSFFCNLYAVRNLLYVACVAAVFPRSPLKTVSWLFVFKEEKSLAETNLNYFILFYFTFRNSIIYSVQIGSLKAYSVLVFLI